MDASVNRIPSSKDERALLIALNIDDADEDLIQHSLDELVMLVATAGGIIIEKTIIRREKIDASYIIGKGQLERIKTLVAGKCIKLVVFDLNTIKPAQIRNLEEYLACRVVGRTEVILDIFARRARSAEAKIQVELAQLKYILPRLKGLGGVLSRLGGGIGTRGPGEKMLETDRRHILRRITKLNQKMVKISNHRSLIRKSRSGQVRGAVVGYTNAGKSTLLNVLAKDDLFVEDRLFATLDAFTRIVFLDEKRKVLITDTVGFINNLPTNLVESFKSTLEEILNAHFLIHVVDITAKNIESTIKTVKSELASLGGNNKETIIFFNKSDLVETDPLILESVSFRFPDAIIGSAVSNRGIVELKNRMCEIYESVKGKEYQDSKEYIRNNIHETL